MSDTFNTFESWRDHARQDYAQRGPLVPPGTKIVIVTEQREQFVLDYTIAVRRNVAEYMRAYICPPPPDCSPSCASCWKRRFLLKVADDIERGGHDGDFFSCPAT